jgi:hypothetical protein
LTEISSIELSRGDRLKYGAIGGAIGIFIVAWLFLSVHYFIASEPSLFARLGSLGAVGMILSLALTRRLIVELSDPDIDSLKIQAQEQLEHLERVNPEIEKQLSLEDKKELNEMRLRQPLLKWFVDVHPEIAKYLLRFQIAEVIGLIVSAIQGGYGDFFVNRFNGCRMWQCP